MRTALLPGNPLTKALHYALGRSEASSGYVDDPEVPIDINQLERALRPTPWVERRGCSAGGRSAPRR